MPKILVIEDNDLNREMICRRLVRRGYEVIEAADGKMGINAAIEDQPDLILMDISLPEMDGWEATSYLKTSEITWDIPIIILTAHATAEDREKSRQVNSDDYETKPVEFPRLLKKIESLLHL